MNELPNTAQQLVNWLEANSDSAFPPMIEGYWRPALELPPEATGNQAEGFFYWKHNASWKYPFPVVYEPEGYDKEDFMRRLAAKESAHGIRSVAYRGISMHRILHKANGNSEFELNGWKWPQGYVEYIKLGVPPSREFYQFVTGRDCPSLPTYGR